MSRIDTGGQEGRSGLTPPDTPGCHAAGALERVLAPKVDWTPQDTDAGNPESSGSPSLWLGSPRGLGCRGPGDGGRLGAVRASDAPQLPEGVQTAQGPDTGVPGSQRRAPRGRAPTQV